MRRVRSFPEFLVGFSLEVGGSCLLLLVEGGGVSLFSAIQGSTEVSSYYTYGTSLEYSITVRRRHVMEPSIHDYTEQC